MKELDYGLSILSTSEKNRVLRFRQWRDVQASLLGKLMLIEGAKNFSEFDYFQKISHSQFRKPYFKDSKLEYNISHSGEFVVCAISNESPVGIDIEEIKDVDIAEYAFLMSDAEMQYIMEGEDPMLNFYSIWTKKEAVMKADGRGLNIPLRNVVIDGESANVEGTKWALTTIALSKFYSVHLATRVGCSRSCELKKYTMMCSRVQTTLTDVF
jgi:4'-phosphopantetheinyl transferase